MSVNGGVTTAITRQVRPEHRREYEARLSQLLGEATDIDGYLGADVRRPASDALDEPYVSVVRFASLEQLHAFERSDLHASFQRDVAPLVERSAVWDTHTGLEFWFDPPPGTVAPQPVRWRMAVVLGVIVYLLVLVFGTLATLLIGGWPAPLRLALVIAVEILLMTYVLLPRVTRTLAAWIYPTRRAV